MSRTQKTPRSLFVMKFGKAEHIQKFINEGLVYMNCTDYFRQSQNDEQGDKYEGAGVVHKGKIICYRSTMLEEKLFCLWHINNKDTPKVKETKQVDGNLYELTIDTRDFTKLADADIQDFKVALIKNHKEFNARLINELNKHYKGRFWCQPVSYYRPTLANYKPISPFMKPVRYRGQNELRYLVLDDVINAGKPLEIRIGNISDIAQSFDCSLVKMYAHRY